MARLYAPPLVLFGWAVAELAGITREVAGVALLTVGWSLVVHARETLARRERRRHGA